MLPANVLIPGALLLALPLLSCAQGTDMARDRDGNLNNGYSLVPPDVSNVQGNAFLLPQWVPATLRLTPDRPDRPAQTLTLKYDLYHQELRARRPQGDSVIVPLSRVQEFTLQPAGASRRFVCYPAATLPAETGGSCGEVLAQGAQVQLLKFWSKVIVKSTNTAGSYGSNATISQLEEQTHYYLHWSSGRFAAVRLKRASLEQALAGQPAALAALKARKGGLGSEAEMAAAIMAIDPLLATSSK